MILKYFFFYRPDDQNPEIIKAEKNERTEMISMIEFFNPDYSYIAANCILANNLIVKMRETTSQFY
jgi:hypothetical protein